MTTRSITRDNLGAWLIKCDPEAKFDLPSAMQDGMGVVGSWSVKPGYRAEMMVPNDKIILWVSGNGRRMTRGIWGIGRVVGEVEPEDYDERFGDLGYWLDADARAAVELFVPIDVPLFDEAVSAEAILAAGIDDLEVQRMAQGSNPSWVSREQLERLESLLPSWPDEDPQDELITVADIGASFGSPEKNAVVELRAMAAVVRHYGSEWEYKNVSAQKVGWDLEFTHRRTGGVARVEVKGVSGERPAVLLTANELRAAGEEQNWVLAVVTRALGDAHVTMHDADRVFAAAQPYVFKVDLAS